MDFYTLEYLATQIAVPVVWHARLGKIPVNYWPLSKRVISEFVGKADSMKSVKFFICTQTTRMCHFVWKALENTKGGSRRPLHPMFPKWHHLWTGTFTGEGPSLQLVFITHWQKLFNTETSDKKLQHLHRILNINELLRAAFALWAHASRNWV